MYDYTAFTLRLDGAVWKTIGHIAVERGISKAQVIRDSIDEYLNKNVKNKEKKK